MKQKRSVAMTAVFELGEEKGIQLYNRPIAEAIPKPLVEDENTRLGLEDCV